MGNVECRNSTSHRFAELPHLINWKARLNQTLHDSTHIRDYALSQGLVMDLAEPREARGLETPLAISANLGR